MDHRQTADFFAVTAPGLEQVCATELTALGMAQAAVAPGGVAWRGRLADLYRANLHLRTASRVVVRLAAFRCRAFPELYRQAQRLPWGSFLRPGTPVHFRVTCHTSRLMHSGRIAETLQAALGQLPGGSSGEGGESGQLVIVRVVDDLVELSVDSSGELLHRRGLRTCVTAAPLRETLAAGILQLLGWHGEVPLADPLCGTGTFLLEGALLAARRAPGLQRPFAFMNWPGYRPGLWAALGDEARRGERPITVRLSGGDADGAALAAARTNLTQAGLEGAVALAHLPLSAQPVHGDDRGLVICNPPYGKRLTTAVPLSEYFAGLGRELRRAYPGWRLALLCPEPALARATGLPLRRVALLDNGGLKIGLYATPAGTPA